MRHTPRSLRGMVTAPHHLAAQAGRDVLADGGTAVEAAVATAACLAVVYPHMTGIGGDGFWLVAEPDGRTWAVDACGAAAATATPALYSGLPAIPWRGPTAACTVAGTISGWQAALAGQETHLPLARLLRDAIHHARHGVTVTAGGAEIAASRSAALAGLPGDYALVFEPEGRPLAEGDILRQPTLGETLERLAAEGLESFYRGKLADEIAADLARIGSPLTATDLGAHHARAVEPLSADVSGARLFNLPPPTQGLASLLILALFDRMKASSADGFAHVHGLVEATKQAFRIRDRHVGEPATMTLVPQSLLDDDDALESLAAQIDPRRAAPWPHPSALGDTTWFAAADSRGQVVSCIQSTYFEFGSGIVLPGTGIVWQNRGCSFSLSGDGPNLLRPGARPFHTLNPALARFADGRVMAYGTMGGEGQPQTQAAVFSRYARFDVPLQAAVTAPRWLLGRTWGEDSTSLKIEEGFAPELYEQLADAGHIVERLPALSSTMGHAGALVRHPAGVIEGASDPRSDGSVASW